MITGQNGLYFLLRLGRLSYANGFQSETLDCLVSVYLLRYKGSDYVAILLMGTSKGVHNSCEFTIKVFVLTFIFSYLYTEILLGILNYFAISMNS